MLGVRGTGRPHPRRAFSAAENRPVPLRHPAEPKVTDPMANILTVSASPSAVSKTALVRDHIDRRLRARGHEVTALNARELPPAALLAGDATDPAIAAAVEAFERADAVVVATPVYKAAYSGLLKTLLDVLPQRALDGKVVLPLATGGTIAHLLVLDYAIRPVLHSLGCGEVVRGYFLLDQAVTFVDEQLAIEPEAHEGLLRSVDAFAETVEAKTRAAALA